MCKEYVRILSGNDVEAYEGQHGYWLVASLYTQSAWPEEKLIVVFRNRKLLLLPEEEDLLPAVAILNEDRHTYYKTDRMIILHFLSSLAWCDGRPVTVIDWTGGGRPFRSARGNLVSTKTSMFRIGYLPDPQDKDTRLALALYREALGLENIAYKFLSFYKIINLKYPASYKVQIKWIDNTIQNLTHADAKKRVEELAAEENDVSKYLYESCRCAIAHAGLEPTVDPESIDDEERLRADLPLIKHIAELLIETEYGVKSRTTVWQEHLYELSGFKEIMGSDLIARLKKSSEIIEKIPVPDLVSIRLFGKSQYPPFEQMKVNPLDTKEGIVHLECFSQDRHILFILELNFPDERLGIDPIDGIIIKDDGSPEAAEDAAETQRFVAEYLANGILEIWEPVQDKCLGWCDPFIPENINLGATIQNFNQAEKEWREEAEHRRQSADER